MRPVDASMPTKNPSRRARLPARIYRVPEKPTITLERHMKLPDLTERQVERVDQGLAREALDSLTLGLVARTLAIVVIAASLAVERPLAESGYYFGALGAFMVLGFVHRIVVARLSPATWPGYIFIAADFCFLAYVLGQTASPAKRWGRSSLTRTATSWACSCRARSWPRWPSRSRPMA